MADQPTKKDLKEAFDFLDAHPLQCGPKGKSIARLADEDDEDGPVVITDEQGNVHLTMPREDYEALREHKKDG